MVVFPNAKINLGLNILSKRKDGYHDISSVFYPIPFEDIIEVIPANDFRFEVSGLEVPGSQQENLITKAYQLLKKEHNISPVRIHLHKIIPMGAGLGGGSSDAAFTIKCLDSIFNLSLSLKQMQSYAGRMGSDCPFFIRNEPVLAEGTGNVFSEINVSLEGKYLVLVCPEVHIRTQEAYSTITPGTPKHTVNEVMERPLSDWKNFLHNDFEKSVFGMYPEIEKIKEQMYDAGAIYASMTGSGSSIYGIFKNQPPSLPFPKISWQGGLM